MLIKSKHGDGVINANLKGRTLTITVELPAAPTAWAPKRPDGTPGNEQRSFAYAKIVPLGLQYAGSFLGLTLHAYATDRQQGGGGGKAAQEREEMRARIAELEAALAVRLAAKGRK